MASANQAYHHSRCSWLMTKMRNRTLNYDDLLKIRRGDTIEIPYSSLSVHAFMIVYVSRTTTPIYHVIALRTGWTVFWYPSFLLSELMTPNARLYRAEVRHSSEILDSEEDA